MWHLIAFALPWLALAIAIFVNLYAGLALLALLFVVYNRVYSARSAAEKPRQGRSHPGRSGKSALNERGEG
jgi:hypothetical protein